jgi:transposase InsO family protein
MQVQLHKNARTTPAIRAEMQAYIGDTKSLSERYGVTWETADKWRKRDTVNDLSHTPHRLATSLNVMQEEVVLFVRNQLRMGLDDLLAVTREFVAPTMSRSALARMLSRRGVLSLKTLLKNERALQQPTTKKHFKAYDPGFIHIDIKYLPKLEGEAHRQYLFVAIDRATRWVFAKIYEDQTEESSTDFLAQLEKACPIRIVKILTDNGTQFTDRFSSQKRDEVGNRIPTGQHAFDQACITAKIEHRLIPPRHPQTNGMVERFNGRISEVLQTHHFDSKDDLKALLTRYIWLYNHQLPQKALGYCAPIEALKTWQKSHPTLFKKTVRSIGNHTGRDM